MKIHDSSRHSFVRNSLATSMGISFTGLIRAHGGGGDGTTTADPWGETTAEDTTGTWATTTSTENTTSPWGDETTVETTTAAPEKPKCRMFLVTVWVKGYQNGEPIFTLSEADAQEHVDLSEPSKPTVTGQPSADGGPGDLEAGQCKFSGPPKTLETNINTNETHTSIVKDNSTLNPNPKSKFGVLELQNGRRKKYFDVQIAYKWVYPSSP